MTGSSQNLWPSFPANLRSLEKTDLRLGIIRLTDCAPIVIAKERGFFSRHGLQVSISVEPSWSNIRDKVATGLLDGAQMLATLPLAATLGLHGPRVPMVTALSLDLNGNAITISKDLYRRLAEAGPLENGGLAAGKALKELIERDKAAGKPPLCFASVFPSSTHELELRYWLAAAGIHPDKDVRLLVVPPPEMVRALGDGRIDGFCVGEPWNEMAAYLDLGRVILTKYELWNNSPEKVFGVRADWASTYPRTHRALLAALLEAAQWLDKPENRLEAVHVLAGESYVNAPTEVLSMSMTGSFRYAKDEAPRLLPDFNVFYRYGATFPWRSHALWFLSQMARWGRLPEPIGLARVAEEVYRTDLYREVAAGLGIPVPDGDYKTEGTHDRRWAIEGSTGRLAMGPDLFFDGLSFDPANLRGYLDQSPISEPAFDLKRLG
ncbi:MAG: CmpA/NrtA family ABC transporter substrate-binding protein [Bdellovibrionota bacterium]